MKNEMLSTRIDHDTKLAFTSVCEDMGLSTSQAIKLFAKAVINYGGIPFELKAKQPNTLTAAAIAELESGKANTAKDIEELFNDWLCSQIMLLGKVDLMLGSATEQD
jgi:DNA-damage-inducible protein J